MQYVRSASKLHKWQQWVSTTAAAGRQEANHDADVCYRSTNSNSSSSSSQPAATVAQQPSQFLRHQQQ
jgi:hypothetical protein